MLDIIKKNFTDIRTKRLVNKLYKKYNDILQELLELVCNEALYIDSSSHHLPHHIMLYGLSIHYILDILVTSLYYKKYKE